MPPQENYAEHVDKDEMKAHEKLIGLFVAT